MDERLKAFADCCLHKTLVKWCEEDETVRLGQGTTQGLKYHAFVISLRVMDVRPSFLEQSWFLPHGHIPILVIVNQAVEGTWSRATTACRPAAT